MRVARHLDPILSSAHEPETRRHDKRSQGSGDQQNDKGKSDQNSQSTTTTRSSSTTIGTTLNQNPTTTLSPPPKSPLGSPSPDLITISTTHVAIQATTQATTQTITTVVSSANPPSKSSTNTSPFLFSNLKNATVCGSLNLAWVYSGQARVAMTLVVQNQVGTTTSGSMSSQPTPSVTFRTLTTDAPSDASGYVWAPVDVNEGWYTAKAFDTGALLGISAQSMSFFVFQSLDHPSCLVANTTTVSTAPTNIPTHTGRSPLRAADIIGITVGVSAAVILFIIAFMFPRLWRRELPDPKTRRPYLLY